LRISVEPTQNKLDFHGIRSSTVGRKCKLSSDHADNRKPHEKFIKPQTAKRMNIKADNQSDIFRLEDETKKYLFVNSKSPKLDITAAQ
jgi:hypothetical protein